jgi:hypothetical protein
MFFSIYTPEPTFGRFETKHTLRCSLARTIAQNADKSSLLSTLRTLNASIAPQDGGVH